VNNISCASKINRRCYFQGAIKRARESNSLLSNPAGIIISFAFNIFPMKGLKILQVVFSSFRNRQRLINFPAKLAVFSKRGFTHHGAANIFPIFVWIRPRHGVSLIPNGLDE